MPARLRHGDGERAFGHRVHRRGDERDAERHLAGEARLRVGLGGQDDGGGGHQQDVVESERLTDFHAASRELRVGDAHIHGIDAVKGSAPARNATRAAAEALRHDIDLGQFGAARRRLGVAHGGEVALQARPAASRSAPP